MNADTQVPPGWEVVHIRDKFGFTTKPHDRQVGSFESVTFVPMELIPINRLEFSDHLLKKPDEIASGTYFEEGDLLVSKITPCFENGKQGIARNTTNGFGIATTEVIPVKPIQNQSEVEFLSFCLLDHETRYSLAEKMEGATGRQRLSKTVLQDWEILYPPKEERLAIVSVLSKLQSAIDVQEKVIRTLKDLKAATMAKLFREGLRGEKLKETVIGEIPESWEIIRLGDHCKIRSGGTPSRSHPEYWNGTIPWVKTGEINYRTIKSTEEKITAVGVENSSAKLFPAGTLLMAMYGEGVTRGRVAILGIEAATNQACAAFFPDESIARDYLYAWCVHSYDRIRTSAHGANQKNLSNDLISNLRIPRPINLDEQADIGRLVLQFDQRIDAAEICARTFSQLFASMLHLLMTGQVRVTPLLEGN